MESNIVLLALKFALLALVWLFVLAAVVGMGKPFALSTGDSVGRSRKQPTELVVLTGPHAGKTFELPAAGPRVVIIGRDDKCDFSLDHDGFVSQQHLQLTREATGGWSACDLNSQNGTIIHSAPGQRLAQSMSVKAGAEFLIGESLVRLT